MRDSRRPPPPRPPVRVRPAPQVDPPVADDPLTGLWPRVSAVQLALDLTTAADRPRPGRPSPAPTRRAVAPRSARPPAPTVDVPVTATSEAARAAHRFVATCLEILNGHRPPAQLRPLTDPTRTTAVLEQLAAATSRLGPLRRRSTRPVVRLLRLRVCQPQPAVVEAAAVLAAPNGRSWAMAVRLERRAPGWICLVLQIL
ncbi:Rv3235 family protein [Micromonospora sp. WMMD882]|uniref:Rv3235 family protein n=1 Tax=Micromonospora sp. WMMD882 TaxID=3015151 RepID=UPI00248B0EC0|nr:Rv3235 family protein [Micromonospora sp. WMMD882]WBB77339.1 Rv3235 family protein [Micromonospora sp. WMMD882]